MLLRLVRVERNGVQVRCLPSQHIYHFWSDKSTEIHLRTPPVCDPHMDTDYRSLLVFVNTEDWSPTLPAHCRKLIVNQISILRKAHVYVLDRFFQAPLVHH